MKHTDPVNINPRIPDGPLAEFMRMYVEWYNGPTRSAWVETSHVHMYVRADMLPIPELYDKHGLVAVLNIANISVHPQGEGLLTDLLDWIEPLHRVVHFENVIGTSEHNASRIVAYLRRRGYKPMLSNNNNVLPCLYRVQTSAAVVAA